VKGGRKTKRYEAAEFITSRARNVLLITATPHHGDPRDFLMRLRLLDPSVDGDTLSADVRRLVVRRLREDVKDETGIPDRHWGQCRYSSPTRRRGSTTSCCPI
jgi:hypothetical protein